MTQVVAGCLYGVGVGPGDPELMTLKAQRILSSVGTVCVPKRAQGDRGYAFQVVEGLLDPGRQEILEMIFPMTKETSQAMPYWERHVEDIYGRLERGIDCAFVTEGDPLLYSTFIPIYDLMRQVHPEVRCEVVPGVTSIAAACARAGIPLANGDDRVAIVPATYAPGEAAAVLDSHEAVVFMKVNSVFDEVLNALEDRDLVDCAVWAKKVTSAEEELVHDIRTLRGQKLDYLSLLLVRRRGGRR